MALDKFEKIHNDLNGIRSEKEQITAAIYARVSSPNQLYNYSLDEQVRVCRERCELMGWKVRYIFREEGVSAKDVNRPMFKKMMEKAREGRFDVLVFWRLDRLCRSLIDAVRVEKELREMGVALHSVTEQIDTTTPVGRFNFRNLASAAELERDLIRERARMGMHALAMQHKWPNKRVPLGYIKGKDGKLKVDKEEAELVRKIFEMYVCEQSMPQVAYLLNKEGLRTKEGKNWTTPAIKKILTNKLYIGKYKVAGVEDYVEDYRIIDTGLFDKVQEIRSRYWNGRKRKAMDNERKKSTIDGIFEEYFKFLDEVEELECLNEIEFGTRLI